MSDADPVHPAAAAALAGRAEVAFPYETQAFRSIKVA
jgi:hypothetical protein